jgi:alpha-galactosidase
MSKYVALLASGAGLVMSIDNGKGITPPMGWRSWNLFGANVNQQLIQNQVLYFCYVCLK